jgi:hypothetical protein
MKISGYENIEIFNKTQSFGINKYENQILRQCRSICYFHGDHSFRQVIFIKQKKRLFVYLIWDSELHVDDSVHIPGLSKKQEMKNSEIIKIASLVILTAALLYYKYTKKKKADGTTEKTTAGKSLFASHSADDDYEPYSKKNSKQ